MLFYKSRSNKDHKQSLFSETTELLLAIKRILQLTTLGLLAVISGFNTLSAVTTTKTAMVVPEVEVAVEKTLTTKEHVEEYFADLPIMVDIARCESRFRQTDKNGNVLRGEITPKDVGVMQINEGYHLKDSQKLGFNIHTIEGNMGYARYLYEKQGARPWLSSSHCWAKYSEIAKK